MILLSDFQDILISKSGGKPLSKVSNFYSIAWQAMNKVKKNVDLPSAMRTVQLTNPVYTNVSMYPLPTDIALNGIVTLRPLLPNDEYYDFTNLNQRQFNVEEKFNPSSRRYGIRNINGVQYLLINDTTTEATTIQACESLTEAGTVAALGASTGLALETLQLVSGAGSFTFARGIGATNGLEGTLTTALNLTSQRDILAYVFLPTLTEVTGIQLSMGQNSSNYMSASTTSDFFGNALTVGWNLIRLPKTSFITTAGSPNWTSVTYWRMQILGTATTAVAGFCIDSLVANLGALYEIDYYSNYQFQSLAGARMSKPTAGTDYLVLSEGDELDLYTDQFIEIMTIDLKQQGVAVDYKMYGGQDLKNQYEIFKFKFPSQRQLMTTQYGTLPQRNVNW